MSRFIDMTGKRFGRLTIVRLVSDRKSGIWECKCDCGTEKTFRVTNLRSGQSTSCGCLFREMLRKTKTTHGAKSSEASKQLRKTYNTWRGMIERCENPNHVMFHRYGGRGIFVCERWKLFDNFLFDMGEIPADKKEIDRIKNDLGYCKENCHWATRIENSLNKDTTVLHEFNGQKKTLRQWSESTGISLTTLKGRIRIGWSIEKALTVSPEDYKNRSKLDGK